jgi:hypothetical protein
VNTFGEKYILYIQNEWKETEVQITRWSDSEKQG